MVLERRLSSVAAVRRRHTQLASLCEGLEVVRRHRPEVKVGLVPEEPADDHNDPSEGWRRRSSLSGGMSLRNDQRSFIAQTTPPSFSKPSPFYFSLRLYVPQTPVMEAVARLPRLINKGSDDDHDLLIISSFFWAFKKDCFIPAVADCCRFVVWEIRAADIRSPARNFLGQGNPSQPSPPAFLFIILADG